MLSENSRIPTNGLFPYTPREMAMDLAKELSSVNTKVANILCHLNADGTKANIMPILDHLHMLNQNTRKALTHVSQEMDDNKPGEMLLNFNMAAKLHLFALADIIHKDFVEYLPHPHDCNCCDNEECENHPSNANDGDTPNTEETEQEEKTEEPVDNFNNFMLNAGVVTLDGIKSSFDLAQTRLYIQYNYDQKSKEELEALINKYKVKIAKYYKDFQENLNVAEFARLGMQAIATFISNGQDIYAKQLLRSTRK